jgi:DNA-binding MarR family transcriptional regulator
MADWTFFTNHAHALLCVARDPGIRHRDLAARVGITERAAQRIVADLVEGGYLSVAREGRRNRYQLHPELPLRHPVEQDHQIGEILAVLTRPASGSPEQPAPPA